MCCPCICLPVVAGWRGAWLTSHLAVSCDIVSVIRGEEPARRSGLSRVCCWSRAVMRMHRTSDEAKARRTGPHDVCSLTSCRVLKYRAEPSRAQPRRTAHSHSIHEQPNQAEDPPFPCPSAIIRCNAPTIVHPVSCLAVTQPCLNHPCKRVAFCAALDTRPPCGRCTGCKPVASHQRNPSSCEGCCGCALHMGDCKLPAVTL